MAERKQLYSVVIAFDALGILASSITAYDTVHIAPREIYLTGGRNGDYIQIPECSREEDLLANHIEIVFPNQGQALFWANPALSIIETTSVLFNADVQPPICDREILKRSYQKRQIASNSEAQKLGVRVSMLPNGEFDLSFSEFNITSPTNSWQPAIATAQKA